MWTGPSVKFTLERLNGMRPNYMSELRKRNIDIRPSARQTRYESLSLICPNYERESQGAKTFQISATKPSFGILFAMKFRVTLV